MYEHLLGVAPTSRRGDPGLRGQLLDPDVVLERDEVESAPRHHPFVHLLADHGIAELEVQRERGPLAHGQALRLEPESVALRAVDCATRVCEQRVYLELRVEERGRPA